MRSGYQIVPMVVLPRVFNKLIILLCGRWTCDSWTGKPELSDTEPDIDERIHTSNSEILIRWEIRHHNDPVCPFIRALYVLYAVANADPCVSKNRVMEHKEILHLLTSAKIVKNHTSPTALVIGAAGPIPTEFIRHLTRLLLPEWSSFS